MGVAFAASARDPAFARIGRRARDRAFVAASALVAGILPVLARVLAVLVAAAGTTEAFGLAGRTGHRDRSC